MNLVKLGLLDLDSSGTSSVFAGLYFSNNEIINRDIESQTGLEYKKAVILLKGPGGMFNHISGYDELIYQQAERAMNNGIAYYIIALNNTGSKTIKVMTDVATMTGGQYYASDSDQDFAGIFDQIYTELKGDGDWETKDSDGDGLCDAFEVLGMNTETGLIFTDPVNPDTDGDGLPDNEEMGSQIERIVKVDGVEHVAIFFNMLSDPSVSDTDRGMILYNYNYGERFSSSNEIFFINLSKLQTAATLFAAQCNIDTSKYPKGYDNWLVASFIRSLKLNEDGTLAYAGGRFDLVGGKINNAFGNFVLVWDEDVYNYFASTSYISSGEGINDVDLGHFAYTLSALFYDTTPSDFDESEETYGYIFDFIYGNLAGWAGDLQTLVMDMKKRHQEYSDADGFENLIMSNIGNSQYSFSIRDIYADIDARLIGEKVRSWNNVEKVIKRYYTKRYKRRYRLFINSLSDGTKSGFDSKVGFYTQYVAFGFVWPLYEVPQDEEYLYDEITVREFESDGATTGFTEYIFERK